LKKSIVTLFLLACLFSFSTTGFAANTPTLMINDKVVQCDIPPQISNGRLLVPLRVISESMGAKVSWIDQTKTINIEADQRVIKLQLNNKVAFADNQPISLDVPPKLINNRTFVPLRFIGESLNSEVTWDSANNQAIIRQSRQTGDSQDTPESPGQFHNSRTLSQVSWRENESGTFLDLKVNPGNNKISKLRNPDRLVIDLPDTTKAVDALINVNTKLVATVRVGQFNETTTRVVLDLKDQVTVESNQSTDRLTLTLKKDVTPPSPTPDPSDNSIYANKTINRKSNVVVVDAGHGGSDVGAIGVSGRYEKDLTLPIALKLQSALVSKGFQVVFTRSNDTFVSLDGITDIANQANPFAFVSIHANKAGTPAATGLETYTFYGSDRTLANLVQNAILAQTHQVNRGVKEAGFYVIKYTKVPAVLVETGFLSNPDEENFLFDEKNQTLIANAIADAIANFKSSLGTSQ